jgi:prepilin-type N-terminal cleavage/methylation domain-containing protein
MKPMNQIATLPATTLPHRRAFTLIELLVVIAIIAVLASLTVAGLHTVGITKKINTANGELNELKLAIEEYHSQYGTYPPGNGLNTDTSGLTNQLYYELTGVTPAAPSGKQGYQSVGTNFISQADVGAIFGAGGILNSTKGSGEDAVSSKNFLSDLKPNRVGTALMHGAAGDVYVNMLVTSVGGPDDAYLPVGTKGVNPFRYKAPSPTNNNPNSYDLWVELSMGATNYGNTTGNGANVRLISNWAKGSQENSQMP